MRLRYISTEAIKTILNTVSKLQNTAKIIAELSNISTCQLASS